MIPEPEVENQNPKHHHTLVIAVTVVLGLLLFYLLLAKPARSFIGELAGWISGPPLNQVSFKNSSVSKSRTAAARPKFVKGIYVSASTVSSKKRFTELVNLVDTTELNTLVIDVKTDNGELAFEPTSAELKPYAGKITLLGDLTDLTATLHAKGIYLIARLFVFQDPALVARRPDLAIKNLSGQIWTDRKGRAWIDPAASQAWDYNVAVAKEVYQAGFDEIQFDYVRFPSDGSVLTLTYPIYDSKISKREIMTKFFAYLNNKLRIELGIPISVDLFGLTMVAKTSDLNIGQKLESALPFFDVISPMVYPSHYPAGYLGYKNPANYPYEVITANMTGGNAASSLNQDATVPWASFRPWLQDFDLGAVYTPDLIKAEMKAVVDGGGSGWLLWNARNVYQTAALAKE